MSWWNDFLDGRGSRAPLTVLAVVLMAAALPLACLVIRHFSHWWR